MGECTAHLHRCACSPLRNPIFLLTILPKSTPEEEKERAQFLLASAHEIPLASQLCVKVYREARIEGREIRPPWF